MPTSHCKLQAQKSVEAQIPYSRVALEWDLQRLRNAWTESQSNRERRAIFGYLQAVYDLVSWWSVLGHADEYAGRTLQLRRLEQFAREGPFGAVIRCTADPVKVDKRTRSKWSRVLRLAANRKRPEESLAEFVGRHGGINECAVGLGKHSGDADLFNRG
jgi:hypothetical protein